MIKVIKVNLSEKMTLYHFLLLSPYVFLTVAIGYTGNLITKALSLIHVIIITIITLQLLLMSSASSYAMFGMMYMRLFFPASLLLNMLTLSIVVSRHIFKFMCM